jgi:hypothetical protein
VKINRVFSVNIWLNFHDLFCGFSSDRLVLFAARKVKPKNNTITTPKAAQDAIQKLLARGMAGHDAMPM